MSSVYQSWFGFHLKIDDFENVELTSCMLVNKNWVVLSIKSFQPLAHGVLVSQTWFIVMFSLMCLHLHIYHHTYASTDLSASKC